MFTKLLSIIVPIYNSEKHLQSCLDSLLNQNVNVDSYEIICVDDGSSDNSYSIVCEYSDKHSNIVKLKKENGGASSARNLGLDAAKGKYIWFVDSDDTIRPNCLNTIFKLLNEKEPDSIRIRLATGVDKADWSSNPALDYTVLHRPYPAVAICEAIVSNEIVTDHNIRFNTDLLCGEDQMFHLSFYIHSKGTTLSISDEVYFYRQHDDSVIHSASAERRLNDNLSMAITVKDIMDQYNLKNDRILKQKKYHYTWYVLYFLPKSGLNYNDVMARLKEEKLCLPLLWPLPEQRKTLEWRIKKFISRLYSIKPLYLIYYAYTKRKCSK